MTFVHRSRRFVLAGGLLLVTMALAAPALAATIAVNIVDRTFEPADVVVKVGDTVTWTVTKSVNEPHTVTSVDADAAGKKVFDSGIADSSKLKDNGGTFSFKFEKAGKFAYVCQIHADMKGTVTVVAEGATPGGESEAGIPVENRIIGAGILIVTLVVLFGAAIVWRRMNPA